MSPEEALSAARAAGGYADLGGLTIAPKDRIATHQLMEWAVLEPRVDDALDAPARPADHVRERAPLHVLRQYHGELTAEQSRFNMHLLVHVAELEDRLARLEAERDARERPPGARHQPPRHLRRDVARSRRYQQTR